MEPERVKISVAAQILNVKPLTIRRGVCAGRIPFIKTDTKRLFIPMTWIREQSKAISEVAWSVEHIKMVIRDYCVKRYGQENGNTQAEKAIEYLES